MAWGGWFPLKGKGKMFLCVILGRGEVLLGVQMGFLAEEAETREIQKDRPVRSFMCKTREFSSFPKSKEDF